MIDGIGEAFERGGVLRIVRQHRAVDADRVLMTSDRRQLVREIELDVLIDLACAAVRWMFLYECSERIGVDLLRIHRRVRRRSGLLVAKDVEPFRGVVGGIGRTAAARYGGVWNEDQEAAHWLQK